MDGDCDHGGVGDDPDRERYRRLPPRVHPTGTEHDVTPPSPPPEDKYSNPLTFEGGIQGYSAIADYLTTTPRNSPRRVMLRVIFGVSTLAAALYVAYQLIDAVL
ncbi:hypothetical protein Pa4123_65850 [Phytohabitans aurantiacus]|uniref:Phage shock protein PspC N-terminal domain-containing protein n=1 Tax=Phytohabitans aurantiacus TaxID=3016789 RepID=A0ABQ5R3E1_9ACTN|nr:hypothetical protein Pa4123_65850 [Phytohabitans aurantiacus]